MDINSNKKIMALAIEQARDTMNKDIGGPFGAAITDKEGNVICVASNSVIAGNDPTAHAEINAIREACRILNTIDLSDYYLFTTAFPCPMCVSAIIWSNIKKVFYGCEPLDAEKIGFRDQLIYQQLKKTSIDSEILNLQQLNREECLKLFEEYQEKSKSIY